MGLLSMLLADPLALPALVQVKVRERAVGWATSREQASARRAVSLTCLPAPRAPIRAWLTP